MARRKQSQAYRVSDASARDADTVCEDNIEALELREEQLVAHKDLRELGEIEIHTEIDEVPGRLEVEAYREEVIVEREAVCDVVRERQQPWEDDGVLIVPIYEEQLVVSKRLVLRERMRIRRVGTTERQLFQDTLRRERLVVEDPNGTGLLRETYPVDRGNQVDADSTATADADGDRAANGHDEPGFFEGLVRKALD